MKGLYYPAAVNPAPVAVLMHWVMSDMSDWFEIASWLQNRGFVNPFPVNRDFPWWRPDWFPPVSATAFGDGMKYVMKPVYKIANGTSYGVFIFTYRGCEPYPIGCINNEPDGWLLDSQAAMLKATELEGADPTRIVGIGSSIGADGAADACDYLNQQKPASCQGSFSLSPGDFLKVSYLETVKSLGQSQPPTAAWCLADPTDFKFCDMASIAGNPAYQYFQIPKGGHGNPLLSPGLEPLPMQLMLDFLVETVGP